MNPYFLLAAAVAWALSLAAVGTWQNDAGHTAERSDWQARENVELRTANVKIAELNNKVRADETAHATRLNTVSTEYQKDLKNAKAQREKDIAAARLGTLSLRFTPAHVDPGGSGGGETASGASGCDGGTTGELPRPLTADLFQLVGDADEVVHQLQACQGVVRSDRGVTVPP